MMMMIILRALLGSATASVLQTPIPDRVLAVQGRTCRTRCLPITGEKIGVFLFAVVALFPPDRPTRAATGEFPDCNKTRKKFRVRLFPVTS